MAIAMETNTFTKKLKETFELMKLLNEECLNAKKICKQAEISETITGIKPEPYKRPNVVDDWILKIIYIFNELCRQDMEYGDRDILIKLMQLFNDIILTFPVWDKYIQPEQIRLIFEKSYDTIRDKDPDLTMELLRCQNNIYELSKVNTN